MSNLEDIRKVAEWVTVQIKLPISVTEWDKPFRSDTYEPDTWFLVEVGEPDVIGHHRGGCYTRDDAISLIRGVEWGAKAAVQLLPIHFLKSDGTRWSDDPASILSKHN